MRNRHSVTLSLLALTFLLGACQSRIFGLDETVWSTLSEPEREKVIDGYNKRKEIELLNAQKERAQELENERHRQEVEAQTAPIYAAADAVSAMWGNSKSSGSVSLRIQAISSKQGKQVITIGNEAFEVSTFSNMSEAWVAGQKVELIKNEDSLLYPVKIKNRDNGESVEARKAHR